MKYLKSILPILLGFTQFLVSQNNIHFDHISTEDGLSQSDINGIYQDNDGFMWFATHDGLNKYDGYTFTTYTPEINNQSISSNLVYCIEGDKNGNIWIGTTGGGLNLFNKKTEKFTHFKHDKKNIKSLSDDYVTSVLLDSKNRLWVGTFNGISLLDLNNQNSLKNKDFQRFVPEYDNFNFDTIGNAVSVIYEDSQGQILVGASGGLFKLSRNASGDNYFKNINNVLELENVAVRTIKELSPGRFLIGNGIQLYCQSRNPNDQKVYSLNAYGHMNSLLIDDNNNIWAGTNTGLYFLENLPNQEFPKLTRKYNYSPKSSNSLSKDVIKSLYKDKTGVLWIGTNGGGLNKYDPTRKQFKHIRKTLEENSLSYDKIRSFYEDSNGCLWIGTEGGGLNMLAKDNDDGSYSNFQSFGFTPMSFALEEISFNDKKMLLIGGENASGLNMLDISNPHEINKSKLSPVRSVSRSVFSLLKDSDDNLWIGTYNGGVHRWIKKEGTSEYQKDNIKHNTNNASSISNDIIRDIFEDSYGNIWFATGDGLCKLSTEEKVKKTPRFEIYKNNPNDVNSLSHNYSLAIYQSENGDLWVGTFGGGLNKFVPGKEGSKGNFIRFSEKDGLPNNVIKGILEDDNNNLWLSTNKGLSKFNIEHEKIQNYDTGDGLQSNEFQELACIKRKSGEMLFGGINGFNAFYPKDISENGFRAETVVTNFSIFNKKVEIGKSFKGRVILEKNINKIEEIKLKHNENSFSFEFSSLHFAAPDKNNFAYMLEGFDENWVYTTSDKRFANYTNLEPGDYKLKVKASNNDGLWDESPSEILITVIPPIWKTNFAYFIYLLMAGGILLLFWRYTFIRTTEKHQLELEHLEKEQSEEMQRIKLEFFTNISHEFRTPLTLIKGPLEYLQKKGTQLDQQKVQEQYTLMHKNTNYLMRLVNQLLDFRKINQGKMRLVVRNSNIVEFIKEIAEPFQFLALKKSIDFRITSTNNILMSWFDHDALEKIMNNILSNAFKFTPNDGLISIIVSVNNNLPSPDFLKKTRKHIECIEIQIIDNGPGIKKNKINNIFERFYIEKNESKSNREGVGIGLSFTKNLIELHQGRIEVTSEEGLGTTFNIKLPIDKFIYENIEEISCKEISDNDFLVRSSETESFAIGINDEILDESLSKLRPNLPVLLVVDDNPDIRRYIRQSLDEDYSIYEAENGVKALKIANDVIPNIILSDVIMPEMDGIEFCQKVKSQQGTSHIPVILLTAKSSEKTEMEGLKIGADDYLTKPFNMDLLKIKLSNIISHRDEMRKLFNRKISLQPSEVTVTSMDEKFLNNAIEIAEKHMMNTDFNVEMLVKEMGLSRSNLYLKFKELTGLSSSEFIRNVRLKRAVQLLESSDLSVKEIMYMTGFNTASYFSKCFKKQFGVIPREYVKELKKKKVVNGENL